MLFTLEALEAKHGDCLLLHYGTNKSPGLIVIDGGPAGTFKKRLKKRLSQIKQDRSPDEPLPIRLVMVSHIDADHIQGILDWFHQLNDLREAERELPQNVLTLWHNSFDDLIGHDADVLLTALEADARVAATGGTLPAGLPLTRHSGAVLASVKQGRDLRDLAETLSLTVNEGFQTLVMANEAGEPARFDAGNNLRFLVLGPSRDRIKKLQDEWDKELEKLGLARPAAALAEFTDTSVSNLASIIVLAEAKRGSKKIRLLLTGDARGDDVLSGLNRAGLLKRGKIHVDLLKLPHHGSDHNVSTKFFQQVTADHYVVSADGKYDNPALATFQMLLTARGSAAFDLYLTHSTPKSVLDFLKQQKRRPDRKFRLHVRDQDAHSLSIHFGNEQPAV